MPEWFWAASGILAALLALISLAAFFDEDADPFLALAIFVALIYLNTWIWSHT